MFPSKKEFIKEDFSKRAASTYISSELLVAVHLRPILAVVAFTGAEDITDARTHFEDIVVRAVPFIVEIKEKLDCRPCGLHGFKACPKGHFKCAEKIDAEQLLEPLSAPLGVLG